MTKRSLASRSKKVKQDVLTAMRAACIRPEIVHAYERTGFLLDEAGYKNLPPDDKAKYDAAIDEYCAKKEE